jgi:hypothetical protein
MARRRRRARIEARLEERRVVDPVAVDQRLAPAEQRAIERVRERPPEPVERDPDDPPTLLDTIAALLRPITDMASGIAPAEASVAPVAASEVSLKNFGPPFAAAHQLAPPLRGGQRRRLDPASASSLSSARSPAALR